MGFALELADGTDARLEYGVSGDVEVVVGALVAIGAGSLPHTGSPGWGESSLLPLRKMTGIHTPALLVSIHAHQWLVRFSIEYTDPSDWHRNRYRSAGRRAVGLLAPAG